MNKLSLNVKYQYYNDERFGSREELHPLSFLHSFNPNTILKMIEDILHYVFIRGRRKDKYWSVYNGRYLGKQYFTTINIIRHNIDNSKMVIKPTERWLFEVYVFNNYKDWKEGLCKSAITNKGYVFWDITQLLQKVFDISEGWDKEVFIESMEKCIKPHLNRHNIKSFDELYEKCRKCNDELFRWENEYRKIEFEKNREINELFDSVTKNWVEE